MFSLNFFFSPQLSHFYGLQDHQILKTLKMNKTFRYTLHWCMLFNIGGITPPLHKLSATFTIFTYLLLVKEPSVCLQVSIYRGGMHLCFTLSCFYHTSQLLCNIHRLCIHYFSYVVIQPCSQHSFKKSYFMERKGLCGSISIPSTLRYRCSEACCSDHPYEFLLHILKLVRY